MASSLLIHKHKMGKEIDITEHQGIIKFLFYLNSCRPDIVFCVCMYTIFQASHRESQIKTTKPILRYLSGTSNHGLWFPKENKFGLVDFSILILQGSNRIRRELMKYVTFFKSVWFRCIERRKRGLHFLPPRHNM